MKPKLKYFKKKGFDNMNNKIKMILDVIMTILFLSLMKVSFTGLTLHKIIGLGIFTLFVTHMILNHKWISSMIKNINAGKVKGKTIFMFILNVALFFLTAFTVISGICISLSSSTAVFSQLHHFVAYTSLILISIHLGLHWNLIMNFFKRAFKIKNENGTATWLYRAASLALAIIGVKALLNPNIQGNFTAPFVSTTENTSSYTKAKTSDDNNTNITQDTTNGLVVDTGSLDDYLSKLYCSGCHNRCPLTNLRCGRGQTSYEEAVAKYNEGKSNSSSTSNSSGNSESLGDYIGIMSLFIAGTHYIVTIPKKLK